MEKSMCMTAALCATLAAGAFAAQQSYMSEKGQATGQIVGKGGACAQDAQSLCANAPKGGRMACLAENLAKVQNATCKSRVEKYQTKNNGVKKACSSDISSDKCTGLDIGTGLLKCLEKNRKSLSDGCKAELKRIRGKRGGGKGMGKGGQGKGGEQSEESEGEGEGSGE
jgi:hypothetical protein